MKPRGRNTSGALAWAVALTLAMLVGAGAAAGFSCAPRDPREAPNEAMASGKWKVVKGVIEAESIFGIRLRVERTCAAEVARIITLPGQSNANRVGQPWTFYIQRNLVAYDYTDCGGSHAGLLTPEERSVLGAGLVRARPHDIRARASRTGCSLGCVSE